MTVQQITQFLNCNSSGTKRIVANLSSQEMKAVRSAVLIFNMTPRASNLISSFEIRKIEHSLSESLNKGSLKTWIQLAMVVGTVALTVYFALESNALVWVSSTSAMILSLYLNKSLEFTQVEVKIEPYNPKFPQKIANDKTDEGVLVDPVTYDPISNDQIGCGKYLYLSNFVVSSSPVMRVLVGKPFLKDQHNCLRFAHPLEGQILSLAEGYNMTDRLEEIFGFDAIMIISPLYEYGKTATPAMKIERFLNLFDPSAYPYLKGFEQDIQNLQQDL